MIIERNSISPFQNIADFGVIKNCWRNHFHLDYNSLVIIFSNTCLKNI
jgi:hypothetical protein